MEYESTPTSVRDLAQRFGLSKSALADWIQRQGWTKYRPPGRRELDAARRQLRKLLRDTEASELARGLAEVLEGQSKDKASETRTDQNVASGNPGALLTKRCNRVPPDGRPPTAEPPLLPALSWDPDPFRARTAAEQNRLRMRLAELRGVLTARQIAELDHHEQLVADYEHLIRVYLAPENFLNLDGLDDETCRKTVAAVRNTALAVLLPTERDTLAGAIRTATASRSTVTELKRLVIGISNKLNEEPGCGRPANAGERDPTSIDLAGIDTATLRNVHRAMEALKAQPQRQAEPPIPPAPEPLDDLRGQW